jgi:hypothetical protein
MTSIPDLPAICPLAAASPDQAEEVFKATVEHVLGRQGFGGTAFTCDGQELLVVAHRGRYTLGAVYDMSRGTVLLQDVWEDSDDLRLTLLSA